jgi:bifunctional non-homologous end joining protein LigD
VEWHDQLRAGVDPDELEPLLLSHRTTLGVYSIRARGRPWVSTPVMWDDVERCAAGATGLQFETAEVLDRVAGGGDLFAPVLAVEQQLEVSRQP